MPDIYNEELAQFSDEERQQIEERRNVTANAQRAYLTYRAGRETLTPAEQNAWQQGVVLPSADAKLTTAKS
ncbi:MAG TPA: hypothetical protein VHZ52_07390 [Acidobacteriaceae bacterium]|jgi:hypothetical protein|nr:hypothetical protein [Acidobacteriaceae bacterium]